MPSALDKTDSSPSASDDADTMAPGSDSPDTLPSTSSDDTFMDDIGTPETQKYSYDTALLIEVFPNCEHILQTEKRFRGEDSFVRRIEVVLTDEPCLHCSKTEKLNTLSEFIKELQGLWTTLKIESQNCYDEEDLHSRRCALDLAHLVAIMQGFHDQPREQVQEIVCSNHIHNARREYKSQLRKLQKYVVKATKNGTYDPEFEVFRRFVIETDLAKIEGEYFGRRWADIIRPKPEPPPVCQAPGDICVILSPGKHYEDIPLDDW